MLHSPAFWYKQKTITDKVLRGIFFPASLVYGWCAKKRFELYYPVPMQKPVICIGNLVVGGAGKTQIVMSLVDMLKERGYNPHILTRGYGGEEVGPVQVNPEHDVAKYVGDEALLLVHKAPTWVAHNRPLGAQSAIDSGANIVIMDDGFQNPIIYKNFSILAIDGAVGFGNKTLIPAGPLRETIEAGVNRADAVIIIGEDKVKAEEKIRSIRANITIVYAKIVPCKNNPEIKGRKVAAFAGIGRPTKFKDTLEEQGAEVVIWRTFPDHYEYKENELKELILEAKNKEALLLTTAKDYVRLPVQIKEHIQKYEVDLAWIDSGHDVILSNMEASINKK